MKLTAILITIACLHVTAASYAQQITLSEKDAPIEKVFNDIKKQTGYIFFYENNVLNGTSKVTLDVKNATLQETLDQAFKNQPLIYTIAGTTIGVKKKERPAIVANPLPPKEIKGQVTNKKGVPLEGASVLIKRTKTGTLTDARGIFDLREVLPDDIIEISYIGYKTLSVSIGDKNIFNLTMEEATNTLDQVVVQAYGQTSQRLTTGDISTVTAAEIEKQPVMNALTALEGKVPGLNVTQTSGYASAPFTVELEGRANINPNLPTEPLYIIDGVPLTILDNSNSGNNQSGSAGVTQNSMVGPAAGQSPLFSINPMDIESITVLKDADATAIYGSRGANGVIVINTKKGQAGKTKLDVDFYHGISKVEGRYDLMNTQQYIEMLEEAFKNDNITPTVSNAADLVLWDQNRYTNWQNYFLGNTGQSTDLQTGFTGGDKQTTFRIGFGYHRETNIMSVSGSDQRASLQFNLTHHSLNQKLTLSFTNLISYTQSDLTSMSYGILLPPDAPPLFNSEGQPNWTGWSANDGMLQSIVGQLYETYVAKTNLVNSEATIKYEIIKGVDFSTILGYSTSHNNQLQENPIIGQNPANNPTGNSEFGNNDNSNIIVEPQLEYNRLISKGKFDALLGASSQSTTQTGNEVLGQGYTNDNLLGSIVNAPSVSAGDNSAQYKYEALFARLNYNWEDEYLLNISGRRDGSSRFGPGKQFGNFGAVGAAWIFTQEKWLKDNLSWLTFGKLRGSYGITGSDLIDSYAYLSKWSAAGNLPYNGSTAFTPLNLANPDLQWQDNYKLEGALDLGFWKDRLTAEVSVYRNTITHQLLSEAIPDLTGFSEIAANFPATVRNTGLLLSASAKLIDRPKFSWSVNFNIGTNKNILAAFPGLAQSPYATSLVVGQSLSITHVVHYTGIDPQTGQYTFEDKNHEGQINPFVETGETNDLYTINTQIKADGGLGTSFRYGGLNLDLFFHFRVQPYVQSSISTSAGTDGVNQPVAVLNRWQAPGDVAQYPAFSTQTTTSAALFYGYSDGIYSDGSYIRLQYMTISYDLGNLAKKIGMGGCQVFVRGQNLFLLTKYNGFDPATPSFGTLPPIKTIIGGIKFNL